MEKSALAHGEFDRALRTRGAANLVDVDLGALLPPDEVRADAADADRMLHELDIRHEAKSIPFDPRPYVMVRGTFDAVADRFARLFPLLERAIDLYLESREVRDFFRLAPRHDRLIRCGATYRPRIQYCRYDFTLDGSGRPRIYELNTHCPAAVTYSVHFGRIISSGRILTTLAKAGLRPWHSELEQPGSFAAAMLASAEGSGRPVRTVAVLNSRYLTMNTELDHIAGQFRDLGRTAVRCYVEDLRYEGGRLRHGDVPIDLTYNKFDDSHGPDAFECAFSRTETEVGAYLDAYRDGAVFAVNSLPSMYLPEQKSMLAFLHSALFLRHVGAAERDLVEELVPDTVIVRHLDHDGLARLARQRSGYILKRALDTRGRSLIIGRSVTDAQWQRALHQAHTAEPGEDWVAQEFVPSETSQMTPVAGSPPQTVYTSLGCFLFGASPVGLIVRTSREETTNVGRIGFMQPPLLVEEPGCIPTSAR